MPNLAGILDVRPRPRDIEGVLSTFSRILGVAGVDYRERTWHDRRFGAVNLLNGLSDAPGRPAVDPGGDHVMFLDGRIYNLEELKSERVPAGEHLPTPGAAQLCLDLYRSRGDSFVELLNGEFNLLLYEAGAGRVKVFNDRLGSRPLSYCDRGGLFLFALERKAILAVLDRTPEFDGRGVLEFFMFGHNLEGRTVFEGVRTMPPGSVLQCDRDGCRLTRYWRPSCRRDNRHLSLADSAHELGRRLCRAVRMRADDGLRIGLFLSDGLDSRSVAGALARVRRDVTTFTTGAEDDSYVQNARRIAGKLGFRHHRLHPEWVSVAGSLPRIVWRTECSIPATETRSIELHGQIRPRAEVVFNGHYGHILTGFNVHPRPFATWRLDQLIDVILAKRTLLQLPALRQLFQREFLAECYPEVVAGVRRTLERLREPNTLLLYNLWDVTERQRWFELGSSAVDRYLFEQVAPFVDNRVVDWLLRLPLKFQVAQRAYRRMIVDRFPSIAEVPMSRAPGAISANVVSALARQGAESVLKRLRRLAGTRTREAGSRRRKALQNPGLREKIERWIASDAFPERVFDPALLSETVGDHFDGRQVSTTQIACLLTLAEAGRLFVEEQRTCPPPEVQPDLEPLRTVEERP